jgi:hypothetical protein
MIGRIVITSVPRGLDGGAGFQPVLRTHALRPSIAERLAMRAAYPHPFPFGDPRNPRVCFHRIELVGDRAIHVLGSVRDAGNSYTGRSNYLAELIAIDPTETRGLPGGPAYAARSFPWLGRWTGEPRETPLAAEPALPGHDPADPETTRGPAQCPAWQAATGDAGWAGELAKSFLDGKRALIWAGENIDVLELFVEALRLLPASARWQVTFNTCEIEPFPAHWRAVRPELGLVGNYEPTNELRLVLGKIKQNGSRAPDHDLSRRARGEKVEPQPQPTAPVGVDGGEPLSSDDAALRARLREISEERRRRASAGSTARSGSNVRSTRPWIGALPVFVAVLLLLVSIAVWGISQRSDLQPRDDLLSDAPPEKQATSVHNSAPQQGQPEADVAINVPDTLDAPPEQQNRNQQPMEKPVAVSPPEEKADDEKLRGLREAQKQAIAGLEKLSNSVPLLEKAFPKTPDNKAKPQQVVLSGSGSFDLPRLLSPTLELASPYATKDRLAIVEETTSLDNERTWKITGNVSFLGVPNPSHVGRIIARDGKLLIELLVRGSHELCTRLTNSVLLIRTLDPNGQGEPRLRCEIHFSRPLERLQPIDISLLEDCPKLLDYDLAKRTKGIPKENLQWAISCSFKSSRLFTWLNNSHPPQEIRLPSTKTGNQEIEIKYLDFIHEAKDPKKKIVREREGKIAVSGTLKLDPTKWEVAFTPSDVDPLVDTPLFKAKISQAWIAEQVKQGKRDEQTLTQNFAGLFSGWLLSRLEDNEHRFHMFDDFLKKLPKDYLGKDFEEFEKKFPLPRIFPIRSARNFDHWTSVAMIEPSAAGTNIPGPRGGLVPKSQKTYDTEKEFQRELQSILDKINRDFIDRDLTPPCGDYGDRVKAEADRTAEALAAVLCNDGFGPITVQVESLELIARDREETKYFVPIVEPGN